MNSAIVQTVLLHLARLGVREVCIAAGARNTPLVTALLASRGLRVWHFFEERCAAFFALGRMMMDQRPVAVVTTSGTAVAELLPAVVEAFYQAQPLVLVTADRPARFRGTGAPQAIEQPGIFSSYAARTIDLDGAMADVVWPSALGSKPLHINVCLDEPLTGEVAGIDFSVWGAATSECTHTDESMRELLADFIRKRDGLVVLAAGLHPEEAAALTPPLIKLGAPIVAEATANLHDATLQPLLVRGGERALKTLNPTHILRLGAVPSWRWWRDLETRSGLHVMHLARAAFAGLSNYQSTPVQPLRLLYEITLPEPTQDGIITVGRFHEKLRLQSVIEAHPLSEPAWMHHLSLSIPEQSRVFLGNSLPIREWNLTAEHRHVTFANRGANGIDGLASTFFGTALGAAEAWLILGDLSALYDLAAPWIASQMPPGPRRIAVINNGGGKIFSRVESLRALDEPARAFIENRHRVEFRAWAELWQMPYRRVTSPDELTSLPEGDVIVEIVPDAAQTEAFWSAWQAQA
jgi:2-succinyl-5-enolpyruvyl-6-hydroxy-3-cyclohexene-1-carboxylate synthase